jgi:hypothetical protein
MTPSTEVRRGLRAVLLISCFAACSSSPPLHKTGAGGSNGAAGAGTETSGGGGNAGFDNTGPGGAYDYGDGAGAGGETFNGAGGAGVGYGGSTGVPPCQYQGTGGNTSHAIGPEGGVICAGQWEFIIPTGALDRSTNITATLMDPPAGFGEAVSSACELGPAGTIFAKPVAIVISFSAQHYDADLFWSNGSGGYDDLFGSRVYKTLINSVMSAGTGFVAIPPAGGGAGANGGP